jgi:hypothetical protein
MIYLWYTYDIRMIYLWYTYDILMIYLWYTYDILMIYLWYTYDILMIYIWYTYTYDILIPVLVDRHTAIRKKKLKSIGPRTHIHTHIHTHTHNTHVSQGLEVPFNWYTITHEHTHTHTYTYTCVAGSRRTVQLGRRCWAEPRRYIWTWGKCGMYVYICMLWAWKYLYEHEGNAACMCIYACYRHANMCACMYMNTKAMRYVCGHMHAIDMQKCVHACIWTWRQCFMHVCIRTHSCVFAGKHIYRHMYIYIYEHESDSLCIFARTNTCFNRFIVHAHIMSCICTCARAYTYVHTHTHMHTHTHAYTHAHTPHIIEPTFFVCAGLDFTILVTVSRQKERNRYYA